MNFICTEAANNLEYASRRAATVVTVSKNTENFEEKRVRNG